ncbi:hypothetical protein SCN93_01595 [Legionella pneumophila serogroup 1]
MQYIRAKVPGTTYFFTVNLANRSNGILIKQIDILRDAIQIAKTKYPFKIYCSEFISAVGVSWM